MSEIVIYVLGCKVYEHMKSSGNDIYKSVGISVDVFHWTCKHKKTSDACAIDCSQTIFKELLGDDQRVWFFNPSITEQNQCLVRCISFHITGDEGKKKKPLSSSLMR